MNFERFIVSPSIIFSYQTSYYKVGIFPMLCFPTFATRPFLSPCRAWDIWHVWGPWGHDCHSFNQKRRAPDDYQKRRALGRCLICLPLSTGLFATVYWLLMLNTLQVSGTASKLGGDRTYHHFTLLFDVDKDILCSILQSSLVGNL